MPSCGGGGNVVVVQSSSSKPSLSLSLYKSGVEGGETFAEFWWEICLELVTWMDGWILQK
jgi:hypothetical protein